MSEMTRRDAGLAAPAGTPVPGAGASYDASTRSPEEIEREIEETRQRMTRDVDAIGHKLSPEHIKGQAQSALEGAKEAMVEAAREAADGASDRARRAGSDLVESIRAHPMPVAVIGAGIAWLLMESRSSRSEPRWEPSSEARDYTAVRGSYASDLYGDRAWDDTESESSSGGFTARAGEAAERAREKAGDLTEKAREKAGQLTERTRERVGGLGRRAKDRSHQAGSRLQRLMREDPLVAGAAALVLGAAVGLMLPTTERESELMGDTRDRVVDRARETAREAKEVAAETARQVKESAREEMNRNRDEVGDDVKATARTVVDRAKESVERVAQEAKGTARQEAERRNLTSS